MLLLLFIQIGKDLLTVDVHLVVQAGNLDYLILLLLLLLLFGLVCRRQKVI